MPKGKRNKNRTKRQWRGIDTSDITDEALRKQQELLEGGPIRSRATKDLAFVDKGGKKSVQLSAEEKKRRAREKELTVDKLIKPNPHTKPLKVGPPPKAQSKKRKAPSSATSTEPQKGDDGFYDLWDEIEKESQVDPNAPEIPEAVSKPKRRKTVHVPSSLPAVEVAQAGASYRPAPDDHQELLGQAVAFRLKQQDEQKKLANKLKKGRALKMTSDGLGGDAPEVNDDDLDESEVKQKGSDDDEEKDLSEDEHVNQPWTGEKTRSERNRERRRKDHELRVIESKKKKAMKQQLEQLPEILKEIEEKEAEVKQRQLLREIKKKSEPEDSKPKKLGPNKFEETEPDYLLTEQLPESLRKLNNANKFSLIRDRFKSLQKRNIIEPRVKQRKVFRHERKRVEKYSTRDNE